MPSKNHVHKYEFIILGKGNNFHVFRCAFPDCSHYIPKHLAFGKMTVCWACSKEFVLTKKHRQKRPTCGCRAKKKIHVETIPQADQDAILAAINAMKG